MDSFLLILASVHIKYIDIMKTRNFLTFLLGFLGVGAIGGGGLLIVSPSGRLLGAPLSILETSPFTDFLIPGILLFTVIGVGPLWLVRALLKKPESALAESLNCFKDMHWSWSYTIYIGFVLIIWIHVQEVLISSVHFLHSFYMGLALLIIFVTQLSGVKKIYKKEEIQSTFE
jgi:hypothetical protein